MKKILNGILLGILVLIFLFWQGTEYGDTRWGQDSLTYSRAKVVDVLEEDLSLKLESLPVGFQKIKVEMLEGKNKGKELLINNEVTVTHSVPVKEGAGVIILEDEPRGVEPLYSVYNYDRLFPIVSCLGAFLFLLYLVGGKKGLLSALALLISIYIILCFMVPLIYMGRSPYLVTIVTCILCSLYSTAILQGYSLMGLVNLLSVALAFIFAAIIFYIVSRLFHLSGFNLGEVEGLIIIAQTSGLKIQGLLFAGVAIATYGALKDVSVSISSALLELKSKNQNLTSKDLFQSGMNIGKDIIGTMVDTLIFAFLGTSLATVLIFVSYGVQFHQLISSDFLAIELFNGLIATAVIILMVPISSYVSAYIYSLKEESFVKSFLCYKAQ